MVAAIIGTLIYLATIAFDGNEPAGARAVAAIVAVGILLLTEVRDVRDRQDGLFARLDRLEEHFDARISGIHRRHDTIETRLDRLADRIPARESRNSIGL